MSISLSLQSVALVSVSAITPFASGALTTTPTRNVVVVETPSSVVNLSVQGRLLAASAASDTSLQTIASLNAQAISAPRQAGVPDADTLAAQQEASAARLSLQSLIDDPAQRAIANSRFNPVYSALLAAAHQADFMTREAFTRASALPAEIPAPVLPVDRVDGISNGNETAREFAHRHSPASQ